MPCIIYVLEFLGLLAIVQPGPINYNIEGFVKHDWDFVRNFFRENFVHDRELGASMAAYHRGELIFHLSGGWFDQSQTRTYDDSALQLVFSTSKGIVAGAIALAVQRGLIDYSTLVTRYWPEYGQNGKENTTVADLLSHRAGLPNVSVPIEQYWNWTSMIHMLEQEKPLWSPGSVQGYHAVTYGWLAGELLRRADPKKRCVGRFIQDEISNPMNLELFIGLPANLENRVSPISYSKLLKQIVDEFNGDESTFYNNPRTHQAEIPAINAITNARSVAKFYAGLIGDLDNGTYKRIVTEDTLKLAIRPNSHSSELDVVFQMRNPFGMGFQLFDEIIPEFESNVFGHAGFGGSIGLAVPSRNFSFAYVMNRLDYTAGGFDQRIAPLLQEIAKFLNQ